INARSVGSCVPTFGQSGFFPPDPGYAVEAAWLKLLAALSAIPEDAASDGQSGSMVASGSSRIGIPLRMGYTRLHSLHFRLSSPRSTSGLRHTGQASISIRSGLIMAVILAGYAFCGYPELNGVTGALRQECITTQDRNSAPLPAPESLPAVCRRCTRPCGSST